MGRYTERLIALIEPIASVRAISASHLNMPAPFRPMFPRYRRFPSLPRHWDAPLDLVHFTDVYVAPHVRRFDCARVATLHDMMPHQFRKRWPPDAFLAQALFRRSRRALFDADVIVVPSIATGEALTEVAPSLKRRIRVVPVPLPDHIDVAPAVRRADGIILSVGTTAYYKNIPLMLHALAEPALSGARLVRIGERLRPADRDLARRLGVDHRIEERGFVDEAKLLSAFQTSTVLLQPSLGEGFGMPVAEAMAAGLPVVVSDGGALPEVVGNAGRVVALRSKLHTDAIDPVDSRNVAAAVAEVIESPGLRTAMSAAGLQEAERFRLPAVREQLFAAYAAAREIAIARTEA
ncbi:MAG: glycosyltransferase [Dehalococcoidia bacterium]